MPQPKPADRVRTSSEVRQEFLDFFREKGHEVIEGGYPVVPQDDPTLLFINAGMNPFKDVFLGEGTRPYSRVADTQKCLRVSGKHNDLEEVGLDTYHHTLFEMLGNWSFGDYFKREAITWAWELLVERWGLDPDRLYATVHEGDEGLGLAPDDEAAGIWRSETTIPDDHVLFAPSKDNFWMMGDTGPCGPCSEIHYDARPDAEREQTPGAELVNQDDPRVIEVWNLVFIQYNASLEDRGGKMEDGERRTQLEPLAAKHVDTGMGFERIVAVLQGKTSNYDTDLFAPLFERIAELSPRPEVGGYDRIGGLPEPEAERVRIAMRVIADHARAVAFAVADGASPGNTGRGYVVRRILRRAVRYGYQALGLREPFLWRLVEPLAETMGDTFPELRERREYVERTIRAEEEGFLRTLSEGIELFETFVAFAEAILKEREELSRVLSSYEGGEDEGDVVKAYIEVVNSDADVRQALGDRKLRDLLQNAYGEPFSYQLALQASLGVRHLQEVPGEIAFLLHDTYGFPGDLTALMAREEGLTVDEARFSELMEEQRERARAAGTFGADLSDVAAWHVVSEGEDSEFTGYTCTEDKGKIRRTRTVGAGENARHEVVLDRTPFYAESGGQIGDTGVLEVGDEAVEVLDTQRLDDGTVAHIVRRLPENPIQPVTARVTSRRREQIKKHHSATHLLHAALRDVLGEHVQQKGSLVAPDRLRFDFSHFERVTPEEQRVIERRVNEWVLQNVPASIEADVPIAEAKARGAMALFGEKYGDTVRVVTFDPAVSVELCGGTHVGATGEIGLFRITSEGSVASGVRRIEAVAGEAALDYVDRERAALEAVRGQFKALQKPVEEAVAEVMEERKALEKEVAALKQQQAAGDLDRLLDEAIQIDGVRLVTGDLGAAGMDTLRDVTEKFRDKLGAGGVAVLGATDPEGGKVYLAAAVADDVVGRGVQAGKLVGALAKRVGGGGGGRPQLATAGGRQPENLPDALAAAEDEVRGLLS